MGLLNKSEKVDTHGGSISIYVKKDNKVKVESSVKNLLSEEEKFGIKKFLNISKKM